MRTSKITKSSPVVSPRRSRVEAPGSPARAARTPAAAQRRARGAAVEAPPSRAEPARRSASAEAASVARLESALAHASALGLEPVSVEQRRLIGAVLALESSWVSDGDRTGTARAYLAAAAALGRPVLYVSASSAALHRASAELSATATRVALLDGTESAGPVLRDGMSPRNPEVLLCRPAALERPDLLRALARGELAAMAIDDAQLLAPAAAEMSPAYERLPALLAPYRTLPLFALARPIPVAHRRAALSRLRRGDLGDLSGPLLAKGVAVEALGARGERQKALLGQLVAEFSGPGLVICATPHEVDTVVSVLGAHSARVFRAHAGQPEAARNAALRAFQESSNGVLVTTAELPGSGLFGVGEVSDSAAVVGIRPRPDLRFAVRFHAPAALDQWVQELAWLGRDGGAATAVLFYDSAHRSLNEAMLEQHRLRAAQLDVLVRVLTATSPLSRPLTLEWLALQTGLSRRTTDRLLSTLADFGALSRQAGRVVWTNAEAVRGAAELLGQRLESLREADSERLAAVERLAQSSQCRRRLLGHYFGLETSNCDVCSACRPRERGARREPGSEPFGHAPRSNPSQR